MRLDTMRTLLRRRLGDVAPVDADETQQQWTNAMLDDLLNTGIQLLQIEVQEVAPEWIRARKYIDTTGDTHYPWPTNFWFEFAVKVKDSSAPGGYRPLGRMDEDQVAAQDSGASAVYSRWGAFLHISPAPVTGTARGILIEYHPFESLDADSDVPSSLPLPIHIGAVMWAELLAKGETADSLDPVAMQLKTIIQLIPKVCRLSGGTPEYLRPDTGKTRYGLGEGGSSMGSTPGFDRR